MQPVNASDTQDYTKLQHDKKRTVKCEIKFTYNYSCFVFSNYCFVELYLNNDDICFRNICISFEVQNAVLSLIGIYSDEATGTQFVEALGHSNITNK